jgi:hypothetical protein
MLDTTRAISVEPAKAVTNPPAAKFNKNPLIQGR